MEYLHLDPKHFPYVTKDTLSTELILRYGVVPLGLKTTFKLFQVGKRLNVGVLGKIPKEAMSAIEKKAKETLSTISDIRVYRVDPQPFVEILKSVYGLSETDLKGRTKEQMDSRLVDYLAVKH